LKKIQCLPDIVQKYQALGLELYALEQRQINATLYGDRSLSDMIDNLSPYFDKSLLEFSLSLPQAYKKNQRYLFDWLQQYHPKALQYPYDKINMAPNHAYKRWLGFRLKKYLNGARKYFKLPYDSMNPYQTWLIKKPVMMQTLNQIFNEEIECYNLDTEIKEDLKKIYSKDIFEFRNKFAVITALLAIKLHFGHH
jgi:asparagine synthase (glutamine-hydrolysing)